jgi:hypothetical protein
VAAGKGGVAGVKKILKMTNKFSKQKNEVLVKKIHIFL